MSEQYLIELESFIKEFIEYKENRISLIASENASSNLLRATYSLGLSDQYCSRLPEKKHIVDNLSFGNIAPLDKLNKLTKNIVEDLFCASTSEIRPLSGVNGLTIMLFALTKYGDTIFKIADKCGGPLFVKPICDKIGVNVVEMEFEEDCQLDPYKISELYQIHKPSFILLDSSYILFPHPVKKIRELLPSAKIIYDASQVLGLIAGGEFQNPLFEGADIIHGTTHKTFFGPQKALFLFRNHTSTSIKKIHDELSQAVVSNTHLHHILALFISCMELKEFGKEYAKETISNAYFFASELDRVGFDVYMKEYGYTKSHQIWINGHDKSNAQTIFKNLELANISTNIIFLPNDEWGIRLGTAELTRRGATKKHFSWLAEIMKEATLKKRRINSVNELCRSFNHDLNEIRYSFDSNGHTKKIIKKLSIFLTSR